MNQLFGAAAFALALSAADSAMAASESVCQAKWDNAGAGTAGILAGKAAVPYLDAIRLSGKTYDLDANDRLSALEFMTVCRDGAFANMAASL